MNSQIAYIHFDEDDGEDEVTSPLSVINITDITSVLDVAKIEK